MWVHVGLAVRLGSPMSMAVPLRDYIQEGEEAGLADPNWTPEQINYESYLVASAPHQAHIVSVAAPGQKLPFEYEHHKRRQLYLLTYPRVDPLWGMKEILPVLRQAGVSVTMGTVEVVDNQSGWQNKWGWKGIWRVPDNTYLWPLNRVVRSGDIVAYWWNYWTDSPLEFQANTLHKLLATARLGWMESWDIAAITTLSIAVEDEDHTQSGFVWSIETNPCTNQPVALLRGGTWDVPARLVAARVTVDHPWRLSQDSYQTQVVTSHRQRAQVGIVQSVEQFTKGYFDYGTGGQLWYYLADEPQSEPPLLDTICCPQDRITHAWYARSGGTPYTFEYPRRSGIVYKSYCSLTESYCSLTDGWILKIGYRDSPAFVVPPYGVRFNFQIQQQQNNTPSLLFYSAIAVRTFFFPFSYVPVKPLSTWRISFNGKAMSWAGNQGTWEGEGALSRGSNAMQQPETAFGPYNQKIQYQVR